MFKVLRHSHSTLVKTAVAVAMCSLVSTAAIPRGWQLMGNLPSAYECGMEAQGGHNGSPDAVLKARYAGVQGFGALAQVFQPGNYAGKRLRFRGYVKTEALENWAGLWMRIDRKSDEGVNTLAFDNMQKRPIRGTTDWREYDVVLDVPADATGVYFGVQIDGGGAVRLSDARLEIVGADVSVTGETFPGGGIYAGPIQSKVRPLPDQSVNLDLRN